MDQFWFSNVLAAREVKSEEDSIDYLYPPVQHIDRAKNVRKEFSQPQPKGHDCQPEMMKLTILKDYAVFNDDSCCKWRWLNE